VVNTNLLDHDEINMMLAEVDSLPYQNVVEAVEFSRHNPYKRDYSFVHPGDAQGSREEVPIDEDLPNDIRR